MKKVTRLGRFARLLGYRDANSSEFKRKCKIWQGTGLLEIQQAGYLGDNLHHPKLAVYDTKVLEQHSGLPIPKRVEPIKPKKELVRVYFDLADGNGHIEPLRFPALIPKKALDHFSLEPDQVLYAETGA